MRIFARNGAYQLELLVYSGMFQQVEATGADRLLSRPGADRAVPRSHAAVTDTQ
jgi:hypothetical protein